MSIGGQVDISHILEPESCLFINLNFHEDLFSKSFSKMEFIMAMDYLAPKILDLHMKTINVDTTHAKQPVASRSKERERYESIKLERRERLIPVISEMDRQFIDRFSGEFAIRENEIRSNSEDIMLDSRIISEIESHSPETLIFTGFKTDYEVLASSISAELMGYYSVVVSDATSTYSERLFFSSLELMSQIIEVMDTRDLMKIWGYDQ
ncbi:MAG: isochorismatase family protein [Thermoplasmataceae archaeon]